MGNELGTIGGGIATGATAVAAGVTLGQVEGLNHAVCNCAKYTAKKAENSVWRHGGEAAVSGVATVGCAVAAGVTLGQVDGLNRAVVHNAQNWASAGSKASMRAVAINPINTINNAATIAFTSYTRNLPDKRVRRWLAACASDCYNDSAKLAASGRRVSRPTFKGPIDNYVLKAAIYEKDGKTCLAIKGTDNPSNVGQCVSLGLTEASLEALAALAADWARTHKVNYVTGHSLGGFLAEAVASRLGKDGAAFQSPGGRGWLTCFGNRWSTSTRFEVHLAKTDPVSNIKTDRHIAEPAWHAVGPNPHGIENMLNVL